MNRRNPNKIAKRMEQVFDEETLDSLAYESAFMKKKRTITPHRLALSLICAMASQKVETIADSNRAFNALVEKFVHYKPFHKQLVKPGFAEFMSGVVELMLT